MPERLIKRDGVLLCAEAFGERTDPAVLLIMGATASMLWWPDGFCRQLAARGFFVVRYDNRDTGRSTTYPRGTTPYSMSGMARDALLIMDDYGVDRAHVVGMSLGGMIAQILGRLAPARVASLTMLASGPLDDAGLDLPGISPDFLSAFAHMDAVDWRDEADVVRFQVMLARITCGTARSFDEARMASLARREFRRARDLPAMFNHAGLRGDDDRAADPGALVMPCLVLHGTEDPILPLPHGVALADLLPDARLVILEGAGHDIAPQDWPTILDAFCSLAARSGLAGRALPQAS